VVEEFWDRCGDCVEAPEGGDDGGAWALLHADATFSQDFLAPVGGQGAGGGGNSWRLLELVSLGRDACARAFKAKGWGLGRRLAEFRIEPRLTVEESQDEHFVVVGGKRDSRGGDKDGGGIGIGGGGGGDDDDDDADPVEVVVVREGFERQGKPLWGSPAQGFKLKWSFVVEVDRSGPDAGPDAGRGDLPARPCAALIMAYTLRKCPAAP
jgi:hypothetical protein